MTKRIFIIGFLLALFVNPKAQSTPDSTTTDPDLQIYLLMGQSNMAGRGEVSGSYATEGSPQVFMLDKSRKWVQARHPLHFDKAIAGVGPGLAFALKMANENPRVKIGLVPCAVGGTSIQSWVAGGYDSATKTHPYDDAVARIKTAMKSGVVKGMLWHQGESDSRAETASLYHGRLEELIDRIKSLTGNASLPVVAGELGRYKDQYKFINTELNKMAIYVPQFAVASSEGLVDKGDSTHFDSPSATKMGERMADKMIQLQKSKR